MKKVITLIILFGVYFQVYSQAYNEDRTSLTNYIKRVYNSLPWSGGKIIEGDDNTSYIVNVSAPLLETWFERILKKAQEVANNTFAEPCIKFEMLFSINTPKENIFFYSCMPLSIYIQNLYINKPFEGSRKLITNDKIFNIAVIALQNDKYSDSTIRDKVASMKAKQQINSLINGSSISSESVIILNNDGSNAGSEKITENAMGFVTGVELLKTFEMNNKTIYIFNLTIQ